MCINDCGSTFGVQSSLQSTAAASTTSFGAGGGFKFSLGSGQSSGTSFTGKKLVALLFRLIYKWL